MITDNFLRSAPLRQRLTKDVEDTREILPLKAPSPYTYCLPLSRFR